MSPQHWPRVLVDADIRPRAPQHWWPYPRPYGSRVATRDKYLRGIGRGLRGIHPWWPRGTRVPAQWPHVLVDVETRLRPYEYPSLVVTRDMCFRSTGLVS